MQELTLAVVGIDYPNADRSKSSRRMELLMCAPGEPVELRPEPKNKHDEHAVAVFSARGVQVGYLSAERAPYIGKRLKQGEDALAVFQGLEGPAGYVRVRFGGGMPTLPRAASVSCLVPAAEPAMLSVAGQDEFYPDPEGPEWGA